jgi:hypothetical protein
MSERLPYDRNREPRVCFREGVQNFFRRHNRTNRLIIADYLAEKANEEECHPTCWIFPKIRLILQSIGLVGDRSLTATPSLLA